jgi:hypothetical protein
MCLEHARVSLLPEVAHAFEDVFVGRVCMWLAQLEARDMRPTFASVIQGL